MPAPAWSTSLVRGVRGELDAGGRASLGRGVVAGDFGDDGTIGRSEHGGHAQRGDRSFWSRFANPQMGVLGQYGLSDSLMLGVGGVYDGQFQVMGELFLNQATDLVVNLNLVASP